MNRMPPLFLLALTALLHGAAHADEIVKEGTHFGCRKGCYEGAIACAKAHPKAQFCGTQRQECEIRCDSAAAPPPVIPVPAPDPTPYEVCTQHCSMARHSCIEAGNGEAVCESGSRPCEARCAKQYDVTLPGPKPR